MVAFAAHNAAQAALSVHLVGYLVELGHPPVRAAAMTGLLGVLSVTGRLVSSGLTRWRPVTTVTAAVFAVQALAAGVLPLIGRSVAGAVTCVVGFDLVAVLVGLTCLIAAACLVASHAEVSPRGGP